MSMMKRGMREDYLVTEKIQYHDMVPECLGHHVCEPCHSFRQNPKTQVLIHYVLHGCGKFMYTDGVTVPVTAGQAFLILPNDNSFYQADAIDPWEYYWVVFSGEMTERLRYLSSRVVTLNDGSLFTDLIRRARENKLSSDYFVSKLFLLFSELLKTENNGHRYVEKAARYIEANYMRELTVAELAAMVHLNRSYLTRLFTHRYAMSPKQYLTDVRMQRAAELLADGVSVRETALTVGYQDIASFSKVFKEKLNYTPQYYRKTKINEN